MIERLLGPRRDMRLLEYIPFAAAFVLCARIVPDERQPLADGLIALGLCLYTLAVRRNRASVVWVAAVVVILVMLKHRALGF